MLLDKSGVGTVPVLQITTPSLVTATKLLRTLITNNNEVQALLDSIKPTDTIAIDLECENNLHRYGVFCCLIQVQHHTTY